jgi:hypothetical protein
MLLPYYSGKCNVNLRYLGKIDRVIEDRSEECGKLRTGPGILGNGTMAGQKPDVRQAT